MKRPGGFDETAADSQEPQHEPVREPRKKAWLGFGARRSRDASDGGGMPTAGTEASAVEPRSARSARAIADAQLTPPRASEQFAEMPSGGAGGRRDPLSKGASAKEEPGSESRDLAFGADEVTAPVVPLRFGTTLSELDEADDPGLDRVRAAEERLKRAGRERRSREQRERRRFTEHLRVRRRRALIVVGAVVALALFVIAGVFTPIMAVRDVELRGAQAVNVEELQQSLARFQGVPLALVSDQDVHRAIEGFPLVQRYSVERIPPHTLIVSIEERTPAVALEREGGFDLLDPAGVLLGRVPERPAGVPLGSAELSDTSSPAFVAATSIVRDMPEDLRVQMVEVRASNAQNVTFVLSSGTEVLWGESKDTQRKAVVLRSLLASIGAVSMIDLTAPEAPVFK